MKVIVDNFAKRINRELEITAKLDECDVNLILNALDASCGNLRAKMDRKSSVSSVNDTANLIALYAMIISNKYRGLMTGEEVPLYAEVKEDAPAREPEPVENHPADNFDILWDRIYSLLGRWKTFHDKNLDKPEISRFCIQGLMSEITDGYTGMLCEHDETTERSKSGLTYEQMFRLFLQRYGTAVSTVKDYRPAGPNSIILEHNDGSLSKIIYRPNRDEFKIEADYDEGE